MACLRHHEEDFLVLLRGWMFLLALDSLAGIPSMSLALGRVWLRGGGAQKK